MNEMTLPSRHRIRAEAVWGRARCLSVTEAPLNIESLRVSGEVKFCFFQTWMPERGTNPRSPISKQAALTTAPGPAFKHGLASAGSMFLRSVFGWDSSDHWVECFMMFGSLGSCLPACFGWVIWIIFELFLRNTWKFCSLKMCIAFARYNVKRKPQYNASNTVKGSTV